MSQSNKALFESLHRDYKLMVLQVCLGFVKGDIDKAKDLSQDIFINVWNYLVKFKGNSSYKTWIYRITVNTCLKSIRDNKEKEKLPIESMDQMAIEQSQDIQEQAHKSLYLAIGQLNEIDRLIIMMVLDEVDYGSMAKIMGIDPGNLRVRIHRIKKNLKKILEHERTNALTSRSLERSQI
jgi:RNA polymerase sigma-70 factor (ECF subfamily)